MDEQASVVEPGRWAHVRNVDGVDGLHLEWEVRDGRAVVVGMYVHGAEITTSVLRSLPIQRLTGWLGPGVLRASEEAAIDAAHWKRASAQETKDHERHINPTIADLKVEALPKERRHDKTWQTMPYGFVSAESLKSLRERGFDAWFFKEFATVYNEAAAVTRAPAKLIAEQLGVPVTTVHRWTREARIAGALPPARKGAAG